MQWQLTSRSTARNRLRVLRRQWRRKVMPTQSAMSWHQFNATPTVRQGGGLFVDLLEHGGVRSYQARSCSQPSVARLPFRVAWLPLSLPLPRKPDQKAQQCQTMPKQLTCSSATMRNYSLFPPTKLEQIFREVAARRAGYFDENFSSECKNRCPPPSVPNQFCGASLPRVTTSGARVVRMRPRGHRSEEIDTVPPPRGQFHEVQPKRMSTEMMYGAKTKTPATRIH
jgi:hypothetical protein